MPVIVIVYVPGATVDAAVVRVTTETDELPGKRASDDGLKETARPTEPFGTVELKLTFPVNP